jgi:phosphatidylinositol alpha-mannosyltransferase
VKIALVSPYSFKVPGGVPEHLMHLQAEFNRLGHQATIIAPRASGGGVVRRPGFIEIGRAISIPAGGSRARLTFDVSLYWQVKRLMRREQYDVVHFHEPLMPVLPYMVLLNSDATHVATFHAYRSINHWYTLFKPYMQFTLSRLDARIVVSEPAREFVSQYFPGEYDVVPNGIDVDHYGAGVQPFDWASDGIQRVLFVGRFEEERKGFRYLLRAMARVQRRLPDARLLVVGNGEPERFAAEINRLGVRNVEFIGYVSHDDKARYLASCDVICFPSTRNESFGLVLTEAMASAKPVVASAIPGYASVLTHEREGLLVPPQDDVVLADGIIRLLGDPALGRALGERGRETAGQYAWPTVASRLLEIYKRASEKGRDAAWRRRSSESRGSSGNGPG